MSRYLKWFRIRKYGFIFLYSLLMVSNVFTLMQSFYGEMFAHLNGILCVVRFVLYGQLILARIKGRGPYDKLLFSIIVIEIFSFIPQVLLDYEILDLFNPVLYYILLDAFGQFLLIFLLVDEYLYVKNTHEDIKRYKKVLTDEFINNEGSE